MLRRNPTRIEVCASDRDELEERLRAAAMAKLAAATTPGTSAFTTPVTPSPEATDTLLHLLHPPQAPSKARRIGLAPLATTPTPSPTIPWRPRVSNEFLVAPPLRLPRGPPSTTGGTSSMTTTPEE